MADPTRAAHLVADDALESRGLVEQPDILLANDERDLHGDDGPDGALSADEYELKSNVNKGKGRYTDLSEGETAGESDQFDDTPLRNGFRSRAGSTSSQQGRGSYSRIELGHGSTRRRRGTAGRDLEKLDKRTLRIMWWRSAAINVLYILAWCVLHSVRIASISVD